MQIRLSAIQGFLTSYREKMKPLVFPKLGDLSRYAMELFSALMLLFAE